MSLYPHVFSPLFSTLAFSPKSSFIIPPPHLPPLTLTFHNDLPLVNFSKKYSLEFQSVVPASLHVSLTALWELTWCFEFQYHSELDFPSIFYPLPLQIRDQIPSNYLWETQLKGYHQSHSTSYVSRRNTQQKQRKSNWSTVAYVSIGMNKLPVENNNWKSSQTSWLHLPPQQCITSEHIPRR